MSQQIDPKTRSAITRFSQLLSGHYDIAGILLFGSRARGNHGPDSDADLAILLNGNPQRFLDTKLEMSDLAYDVLLETGINISPFPIWVEEWEHPESYANPAILQQIAADGVKV
jgi:predicted nucleotidyltransferase